MAIGHTDIVILIIMSELKFGQENMEIWGILEVNGDKLRICTIYSTSPSSWHS